MTNHARPDVGAGDDWAAEAEVLSEAVGIFAELARRLPASSPWRDAFAGISSDVEAAVQLGRMRGDFAA